MQETEETFKELIDRTMIVKVLKCDACAETVAEIEYPPGPRLDQSCCMQDHVRKTGHSSYTALKILVIYMCQADKDLAGELSEVQRQAFNKFLDTFKAEFKP